MNKEQKMLKSLTSAVCTECGEPCKEGNKYCHNVACRVQAHFRRKIEPSIKAEVAGESQKSLAREVLLQVIYIKEYLEELKDLMEEVLK